MKRFAVLMVVLVGACSSDPIADAEGCLDLVREYNTQAETVTGEEALDLYDRAERRLDELIDQAIDEGRDADAVTCEGSRLQMDIPSAFDGIGDSLGG